jgi:hypothetical protein
LTDITTGSRRIDVVRSSIDKGEVGGLIAKVRWQVGRLGSQIGTPGGSAKSAA